MTDQLIFEDPANRLPEWARWVLYFDGEIAGLSASPDFDGEVDPGRVFRIVRLTDPAYYCESNPYTDDAGFLPHDWVEAPGWVSNMDSVEVHFGHGTAILYAYEADWGKVRAFRIIENAPKEPAETDTSGGSVDGVDTRERQARISVEAGLKYPWAQGNTSNDEAKIAAWGIIADLSDRRGIKREFEKVESDEDWETANELVDALADIIRHVYSQPPSVCPNCAHLQRIIGAQTGTIEELRKHVGSPTGRINRRSRLADLADELHLLAGQVAKEGKDA